MFTIARPQSWHWFVAGADDDDALAGAAAPLDPPTQALPAGRRFTDPAGNAGLRIRITMLPHSECTPPRAASAKPATHIN